jgi:Ni2+-binding GTPase involved in maturation of urease and hydrogenase
VRTIDVNERLLASYAAEAEHNRLHFAEQKILAVNLMGTPGAGKTVLLEATIAGWRGSGRILVIEGDQATDRDSARIRAAGASPARWRLGSAVISMRTRSTTRCIISISAAVTCSSSRTLAIWSVRRCSI